MLSTRWMKCFGFVAGVLFFEAADAQVTTRTYDNTGPAPEVFFKTNGAGEKVQYALGAAWNRQGIDPGIYYNRSIVKSGPGQKFPNRITYQWNWTNNVNVFGVCTNPAHRTADRRHISPDNNHKGVNRVKAFNYTGVGILNLDGEFYGKLLPRPLNRINRNAYIDVRSQWDGRRSGSWNYSINMMLRNDSDFTHELHIYENYSGDIPTSRSEEWRFTFRDRFRSDYVMRKVRNNERKDLNMNMGNPYYQAWRVSKRDGGRIDLGGIIKRFRDRDTESVNNRNFVPPADWRPLEGSMKLAFIRAGFEVKTGRGKARIINFAGTNFNTQQATREGRSNGF